LPSSPFDEVAVLRSLFTEATDHGYTIADMRMGIKVLDRLENMK
jgi:hypothetical protein